MVERDNAHCTHFRPFSGRSTAGRQQISQSSDAGGPTTNGVEFSTRVHVPMSCCRSTFLVPSETSDLLHAAGLAERGVSLMQLMEVDVVRAMGGCDLAGPRVTSIIATRFEVSQV